MLESDGGKRETDAIVENTTEHTHTFSLQKSETAENYFVCVLWIYDCYLLQGVITHG